MKKIFSLILVICMIMMSMAAVFAADLPFEDVKTSDWFYNDVKTAYETGLINGKSNTAYAPDENMTYAEAIKLAACMNQYVSDGEITLESGEPWYKTYVDYAEDNGIISKNYDYNKNATRSGYMEIFASCLPEENLKEINSIEDNSIPDVKSKESYAPAVYKLYRAGILTGVDDEHNCNPSANIKRSEVAAILTRMMNPKERVSFSMGSDSKKNDDPKKDDPKNDEPKNDELTITTQPKSVTVNVGADATFTVETTGGKTPYEYEWYRCNADDTYFSRCEDAAEWYERYSITNDGGYASLTVRKAGEYMKQDGSEYYCVITDANGDAVTSETATLTVKDDIRIDTQPQSFAAEKGKDADFFVSVNGGKTPYKFQWYYCNEGMSKFVRCEDAAEWYERFSIDSDGGNYSVLTVREAGEYMQQNGAQYYCVITDADGNTITSDTAVLTVTD